MPGLKRQGTSSSEKELAWLAAVWVVMNRFGVRTVTDDLGWLPILPLPLPPRCGPATRRSMGRSVHDSTLAEIRATA